MINRTNVAVCLTRVRDQHNTRLSSIAAFCLIYFFNGVFIVGTSNNPIQSIGTHHGDSASEQRLN